MRQNILKTGALIAMCTLFSVFNLNAQSERKGPRKPPVFSELIKKMDANEDGKLSQSEVKGPLEKDFETIDLNEDGFITEEEFETAPKPKRRERN